MTKFGNLINTEKPVLILFYKRTEKPDSPMHKELEKLYAIKANTIKLLKITIEDNQELIDKLRINDSPTTVIYLNGTLIWRQSGIIKSDFLAMVLDGFC